MDDRREAVRSNARYLRNVRPIDPEEIYEYVPGEPHPAVVRQLLREEAFDLGLVERPDGRFVPVGDDPVSPIDEPVRRLPASYADRLDSELADRYGPDWHEGASGELLRSTIRRLKRRYLEREPVVYDPDVAAGYAIYHLPGYYAAVQYALSELAERGLLGRRLRVLDVGAGVGGPALGLFDALPADALVEYHAVEPSAAADVLETLLSGAGRNVHPTIHRTTAESFEPADAFGSAEEGADLVLACNVLDELDDPEAVLRRYLGALALDGSLLALAPADRHTSVGLRALERAVEDERIEPAGDQPLEEPRVTPYSPAVRLWPGERPTDRGWSFDVRPDLETPAFQRRLDRAGDGEFVNVDVQFSYSILRLDGRRRIDLAPDPDRWARMAEMDRHVTGRIDLLAAKFSHSLSEGDANPLYLIADGSQSVDHYAVLTKETALNRALRTAGYGDLLSFERVLVLWNDDEEAYNLVVDEETIVDRL